MSYHQILGNVIKDQNGSKVCIVNIKDLAEAKFDTWKGQRFISEQHVIDLTNAFMESINKIGYIKYSGSFPYIALLDDKKYIIDGQHRIEAYKKVCEKVNNAYEVLILYEHCQCEKDVEDAFIRANSHWELPDTYKRSDSSDTTENISSDSEQSKLAKKIWNKKIKQFGGIRGMISRANKPQKPNISENGMFDMLMSLESRNIKFNTLEAFEEALDKANENIKQRTATKKYAEKYPKKFEKCDIYNCYLGLINISEIGDLIEYISTKRKPIPKSVRRRCWTNKHGGKGCAPCEVCGTEIDSFNFEAGHIISRSNGGPDKEENLVPICGSCNRSMGSENLESFKKRYH